MASVTEAADTYRKRARYLRDELRHALEQTLPEWLRQNIAICVNELALEADGPAGGELIGLIARAESLLALWDRYRSRTASSS